MSNAVLVTGAFGLVGSATVRRLAADGRTVVATDLDVPENRKAAAALPDGVEVRWADLTDPDEVNGLLAAVAPAAVIHLAAIIAPFCYSRAKLARRVNVDGTAHLVAAATAQPNPPRFVQASSVAVYGARNPHHVDGLLSADVPMHPTDLYGTHKAEAEEIVRTSSLDWVVLRLGGVLTTEISFDIKPEFLFFESALPTDGRIQTVDVRDVATAFTRATTADCVGEILLIGGDDASHRLTQGDIGPATAAAMGLVGALPIGRRGNPDSDVDWFATDWMDTARAQEVLGFQTVSFPDILTQTADKAGWKRYPLRAAAPVVGFLLARQSAYHGKPGQWADPWGAIRDKWGDPGPDRPAT
ncbi:NAD-dependent epimerase/dehydratase family protein [Mycolicibacterium grossiae]|uniref:Oxidoreductase n=1 Tax=Mycolicibacterium grossiae TaxID=1552759 RepID=A0A1E8Q900_9MYCO|nr:NAD(P)-dependent oxidoreductase [Mycolicibacterium grossiae]OFJ55047.1 oxidoreductase [Mycolicibacterium grossiae]QEM47821.1 NAD(P)-dependent oxidoreductase [Mycolicibacterium grossiae]